MTNKTESDRNHPRSNKGTIQISPCRNKGKPSKPQSWYPMIQSKFITGIPWIHVKSVAFIRHFAVKLIPAIHFWILTALCFICGTGTVCYKPNQMEILTSHLLQKKASFFLSLKISLIYLHMYSVTSELQYYHWYVYHIIVTQVSIVHWTRWTSA